MAASENSGNMLQGQRSRSPQSLFPCRWRLAGYSEDQVHADLLKVLSGSLNHIQGICRLMSPFEGLQLRLVKGLNSRAEPIDTKALQNRQSGVVQSVRVGFYGILALL